MEILVFILGIDHGLLAIGSMLQTIRCTMALGDA
jgi:hypothetical protein